MRPVSGTESEARAASYQTVIEGQKKALELAVHGAPLSEVLDVIARTVESQSTSNVVASILLLDEEGTHLLHGAAPSLPKEYCDAIHGITIGPNVGSCGTAAFTGETVVVRDIQSDPLWAAFKELAGKHGLRACWSTPIFSVSRSVLGTFALYHRVPATPSERDREVVELLGRTAGIVIERDREARRRAAAESALHAFIDHLPELAWTARADGEADFYNRRWYEYTGKTFEEMRGRGWSKLLDDAEAPRVIERWTRSVATGEPFEMELTLKGADGVRRWFIARAAPFRDATGKIVRWFGTSTNIDAIKASYALAQAMSEQSEETKRVLLEMRDAKERAERRAAELERTMRPSTGAE